MKLDAVDLRELEVSRSRGRRHILTLVRFPCVPKTRRLRRLRIGGCVYLWKVQHDHHALPVPTPGERREGRCREVFTAFVEGRRAAPARIAFADGDGRHAGYPAAGVVWTSTTPALNANLNTPATARRLIELARAEGWTPETARTPMTFDDGFAFLPALCR